MNYKKLFAGVILFCVATLASWKFFSTPQTPPTKTPSLVQVVLNSGESIATYDGVLATTVFDALMSVSEDHAIPLETKQYDFGIFVNRIGDKTNTPDRAWIYFVNGTSGDVAADKKPVKDADIVEWRYTKPIY